MPCNASQDIAVGLKGAKLCSPVPARLTAQAAAAPASLSMYQVFAANVERLLHMKAQDVVSAPAAVTPVDLPHHRTNATPPAAGFRDLPVSKSSMH